MIPVVDPFMQGVKPSGLQRGRGGITPLDTPCREWQAGRHSNGYGVKYRSDRRRSQVLAHRWVMEQIHGPLSSDTIVMHLCDNPPCFRFDHLQLGTLDDNNADMRRKGRGVNPPLHIGTASTSAQLNADQVRAIRGLLAHTGLSLTDVGRGFGVKRWVVADIHYGRTYKDVV